MKEKILFFIIGISTFFTIITPVYASQDSFTTGEYILEYKYVLINPSLKSIKKVKAEGLMLFPDSSSYYQLLNYQVDGKVKEVDGMNFFEKELEGMEGQKTIELKHVYELNLNPLKNFIDVNKVVPIQDLKPFSDYLKEEKGINPNYQLIKETSNKIAGSEKNPYIKAQKLFEFVATNMKYNLESPIKNTGSVNAIEDIKKGTSMQQGGVCYDYASLYVALLRSQKIPARVVSGFRITPMDIQDLERYGKIDIIYNLHTWVEFYLEPYGWVFADPTVNLKIDKENIFKNFIQTENLYIKKGYNLPFDVFKYSITSDNNAEVLIRQNAVLKKKIKNSSTDKIDNPSNEIPNFLNKEGNKEEFIKIETVINERKKEREQLEEYQKARKRIQKENEKNLQRVTENEEKFPKNQSSADSLVKEKEKTVLPLWKKIIKFLKGLISLMLKGVVLDGVY